MERIGMTLRTQIHKFTLLILTAALASPGEGADFHSLQQAEKISIALTGDVLSDAERAEVLQGNKSLEMLAKEKIRSEGFVRYFSEFWARKLGIEGSINILRMRSADKKTVEGIFLGITQNIAYSKSLGLAALQARLNTAKGPSPRRLAVKECDGRPSLYAMTITINPNDLVSIEEALNKPDPATGKKMWFGQEMSQEFWNALQEVVSWNKKRMADCTDISLWSTTPQKPWFDPDGRFNFQATNEVVEFCGKNLEKCALVSGNYSSGFDRVSFDLTMEPANLIASIVSQGRNFKTVLTTTETVVGSSFGSFLGEYGTKLNLWANFPDGAYPDPSLSKLKMLDPKLHVIERGAKHAGVLTTPSFMMRNNGRRAMANRSYEAFLCRQFVVPEGINPDPNDLRPLTERTYCSSCHKSLEPMAAFFNRWPDTSADPQYIYDSGSVNDTGSFGGQTGAGVQAFGKFLSSSSDFTECAVKRAFEFVNNRPMNEKEKLIELPSYIEALNSGNHNVAEILAKMVTSESFLKNRQEEGK
jgi:hypothetical protein